MRQSLFTLLDADWVELCRCPASCAQLRRWSREDATLSEFSDLGELVRYAQTPGHPTASDEVLACLARRSASDLLAARALLQAVLYALVPLTFRFRPLVGDTDEIAAEVIAAAYERIRTYPVDRRPRRVAANIILDTQQAVSRKLCRPRVPETRMADIGRLAVEASPPSAAEQLIGLIDEAVRTDGLCRADARIILLTRLLDVPAEDLAAEHGCLPHSLRRRRLRAEHALAGAVA